MSEKWAKNFTKVSKNVGKIRRIRLYLSRTKGRFDRTKVRKFPTISLNKVGHLDPGNLTTTGIYQTSGPLKLPFQSTCPWRVIADRQMDSAANMSKANGQEMANLYLQMLIRATAVISGAKSWCGDNSSINRMEIPFNQSGNMVTTRLQTPIRYNVCCSGNHRPLQKEQKWSQWSSCSSPIKNGARTENGRLQRQCSTTFWAGRSHQCVCCCSKEMNLWPWCLLAETTLIYDRSLS